MVSVINACGGSLVCRCVHLIFQSLASPYTSIRPAMQSVNRLIFGPTKEGEKHLDGHIISLRTTD